jgi:poly-gamma-glutamate synthesis protein (capsule biosynthesis protein)
VDNKAIRFSAVGDVTLGDHPMCAGFGAYSRFRTEDPLFAFHPSLDVLRRADLLFGNLECSHSHLGLRTNDYHSVQMRGEPRLLAALPAAGFKVVNVANNHSMQHGDEAFNDTVRMVEESGVQCCGLAADASAKHAKPVIVQQNGLRVGFLGYSLRPRQYFERIPLYAEGEPDAMVRDVEALTTQVDVVVVSVHWGDEFIQEPSPHEISLAHLLADAGATLVIGHHPHVLRGIERYGRSAIIYSLGNFVCDMAWDETLRTSLIFECELTVDGVQSVRLVPVYINSDFQPELLTGSAADKVLQELATLSKALAGSSPADNVDTNQDYAARADQAHRRIRARSQRFFLSKLLRYPAPLLLQQLATYVRNRVHERLPRSR